MLRTVFSSIVIYTSLTSSAIAYDHSYKYSPDYADAACAYNHDSGYCHLGQEELKAWTEYSKNWKQPSPRTKQIRETFYDELRKAYPKKLPPKAIVDDLYSTAVIFRNEYKFGICANGYYNSDGYSKKDSRLICTVIKRLQKQAADLNK